MWLDRNVFVYDWQGKIVFCLVKYWYDIRDDSKLYELLHKFVGDKVASTFKWKAHGCKEHPKKFFAYIAWEATSGLTSRIQHRRGTTTESERGIGGIDLHSAKSATIVHNISEVRSKVILKRRFWPESGTKHLWLQLASVKERIYTDGSRVQERLILFGRLIFCIQEHVRLAESLIRAENSSKTLFCSLLLTLHVASTANT